jgi:LysM repeat protein
MQMSDSRERASNTGEWVKFLLLLMILGGTLVVMTLVQPVIFGRVVPAVMGNDTPGVVPAASSPTAPAAQTATDSAPTATAAPLPTATAEPPTATVQPFVSYTVQPGDNLTRIAQQFGVTVEAISQANNITNENQIAAGTVLIIPPAAP